MTTAKIGITVTVHKIHPTFRGLPPLAPFARAAAAFASDVPRPARAASHLAVPNPPLTIY